VTCLAPTHDRCGEGALWIEEEQALYWCDIGRFLVHRYDPATRSVRSWSFDEPVVALAPTTDKERLLVCLASRILLWRPAKDTSVDIGFSLPGYRKVRLNDGRADPAGYYWVGSMENNILPDGDLDTAVEGHWQSPGLGVLYRVAMDGSSRVMREGIGISNTFCWSTDDRTFYFGDSLANEIRAFDYDPRTAEIGDSRSHFAGFERGTPDGSAIDSEGYLWNCRFGGHCIVRVAPDGRVARVIEMPCTDITICTFGGADMKTLFVLSACMRGHAGERLAGNLFSINVDVPGVLERRVKLGAA
jgi:sugar lactone lactonase YvrE